MRELERIGIFDIPGAVWKIKESQQPVSIT
jgi:hypothetical protein